MDEIIRVLFEYLGKVQGFIYPNEIELHWSILIVLYPFITGLVAGAFILASLERVFNVKEVKPTYRLALLTALAFLLIAPMPLNIHLGHPERALEILFTPHLSSAMAIFGFVYIWYLMVVLVVEIWLDYRKDIVILAQSEKGIKKYIYQAMALWSYNISPEALELDDKIGKFVTIIGVPSAFLLHGYVGFIFGSIKANPWWSSPLMPVIFIFSAMVSGIALVMLIYMIVSWLRKVVIDMNCLDTIGRYLLYAFIIDFSLETLDLIHRFYESNEAFGALAMLMSGKLHISLLIVQIALGTLVPITLLSIIQLIKVKPEIRKPMYFSAGMLTLIGIFAMRWNVVIGGQLFSKSFRGFTTYKLELIGKEGLMTAAALIILPVIILAVLIYLFPPFAKETGE